MKRLLSVTAMALCLAFVAADVCRAEFYYVCWRQVKRGFSGCVKCTGPHKSDSPSIINARTKCPAEQGRDFNSKKDAVDYMVRRCNCN